MIKEKIRNVDIEKFSKKAFITYLILNTISIGAQYAEPRINSFNNYKDILLNNNQQIERRIDANENSNEIAEYISNKQSNSNQPTKADQLKDAITTSSKNMTDITKSSLKGVASAVGASFFTTFGMALAKMKLDEELEEQKQADEKEM